MADRERARQLAAEYIAKGDATGWFEQLYQEGERGESVVPWADHKANPNLTAFWARQQIPTAGRKAVVVGCGFGEDAEQMAAWGFETTGFDVAESAIRACRSRFPESPVHYAVADLFGLPEELRGAFDFVFEANTIQALPVTVRPQAIAGVASLVAPGGSLLVIARGRDENEPADQLPWPVTRAELQMFESHGLRETSFEDFNDDEEPRTRRFRVLYRKG